MNNTTSQSSKSWLAFVGILVGFILIGIGGLSIMSWVSSTAASAAGATSFPVAPTPSTDPTVQGPSPEAKPTSLPPTVTPTDLPTRPKPTDPASQVPTSPPAEDQFQLTVIHSNDTWGYVEPCG